MEAEILKEHKSEPKKEPTVQVCGYCDSWCYQGIFIMIVVVSVLIIITDMVYRSVWIFQ